MVGWECCFEHIFSTDEPAPKNLASRVQVQQRRYGGITFAASEALWDRASSALNCLTAAVLTQEFESLNFCQPPRLLPSTKRSCRRSASSASKQETVVSPFCS